MPNTTSLSECASRFIGEAYEWPGFSWCEAYVQAWMEYYGMTEKKTFKNEPVDTEESFEDGYVVWFTSHERFDSQRWDMEVTFTNKPDPVQAGQWREMGKSGEEACVYIVAIHGLVAWVTEDPEWLADGKLNAWTEPLANIR